MEQTSDNNYLELLQKYLNKTCSREELDALVEWAKENPQQLRSDLESYWNDITVESTGRDRLFEKIMQQAEEIGNAEKENATKVITISKRTATRRRWLNVAAAALFVIAGSTIWYLINMNSSSAEKQIISKNNTDKELMPGSNRAILTLGDGSRIILDSANNGAISKQGNVTVIKLDNGSLAYDKNNGKQEVMYNTISTPRGGQYKLELADGTNVWLNAESSLVYPTSFSGEERKVTLTGEGYFEVAHDATKPFHVVVGEMKVNVLGTHFNVNAYKDDGGVKTTLLQGSVDVEANHQDLKIKPGQQAEAESGFVSLHNDVNLDAVMAWKNGNFLFDRAGIHTVMNQIKRWYDVDVEYRGNVTEHFGGTISRNVNASELFKMLEMTGGVHFEIEGRRVIVMP